MNPPSWLDERGGRMTKGLAMAVLALTLAGCSEKWEGFVYPDKSNLQRSQAVGVYPSLEECRLAARRALADLFNDPQQTRGDYECGTKQTPATLYECPGTSSAIRTVQAPFNLGMA
jgi:hypothetical protein